VIVAGVMSGTSLDGIDVALVRITEAKRGKARGGIRFEPLVFRSTPYPKAVREAILGVSNTMTHTAAIARLHFLLGELYADAIQAASRRYKPELIGMHGQTIFHEGSPVEFLGRKIASTFQIGESAVVAERTGVRTISNFRERDMAAGGQGAPLVPYVDYWLFAHPNICRAALNIGGIANVTIIPAGPMPGDIYGFDTGPGNMVIDALVRHMTGGKQVYDRGGRIAREGAVHERLLEAMLSDPFFAAEPPKSTGREQFGADYVSGLIATGIPLPDLIATATELTARSIANAVERAGPSELIVSGGGVHNTHLMRRLRALLPYTKVMSSAKVGINPDAKEAIAFAILAYEFVQGHASNLPRVTGAHRKVVLGKDSPGSTRLNW
jgi:anhydro-N-acetylmuramic acid kinase